FESIHLKRYSKLVKDNNLDNTLKSYSFLIEDNNKTIIYTSDIVNLSHINDELAQADFIIVDGLHIELEEIERLQKFEGLQIIITHYSFDSAEKLKQIVNANPQISFANEKELIEIL
ncbi:MAG: hypothetical protein U9N34_06595, partial [Candidatus Cloacimonadota bacterium]|nr:hypothetical protein [Candidatus Cloacimonadota bacterium]